MSELVPTNQVEKKIVMLRGKKVLLSQDLAELYGVETKALVQAVKRNMDRFPPGFVFQLTRKESEILKSQFVTSRWGGARRAEPYAFTEQGIAMQSSVLRSKRAIRVNLVPRIPRNFQMLHAVTGRLLSMRFPNGWPNIEPHGDIR